MNSIKAPAPAPIHPASAESSTHGITRRRFIKRTGATAIATVIALNAFRNEMFAQAGGYSFVLLSKTRTYSASGTGYWSQMSAQSAADAALQGNDVFTESEEWGSSDGLVPFNPPLQTPDPFSPTLNVWQSFDGTWSWSISGSVTLVYWGALA